MFAGIVQRITRNVLRFLVGAAGEPFGTDLCSNSLELLNRSGAIHVARDRQHFLFALLN